MVHDTEMEKRNIEQPYSIKFCAKLGDSATQTFDKGDDSMSSAQVFRWHREFKNGRESVTDEPRCGRAVEMRTDDKVHMLADKSDIDHETMKKF